MPGTRAPAWTDRPGIHGATGYVQRGGLHGLRTSSPYRSAPRILGHWKLSKRRVVLTVAQPKPGTPAP
jgi:hypothetical protein